MRNFFLAVSVLLIITMTCTTPEQKFQKAQEENTIKAYQEFVDKYPNSKFADIAGKKIASLAFEKAISSNTEQAFIEFIDKYPESELVVDAKKNVERIAFEQAAGKATEQACRDFIEKYPDSELVPDARKKMEKISFDEASRNNTKQAYKEFIAKYPGSELVEEAQKKIGAMLWKTIYVKKEVLDYLAELEVKEKRKIAFYTFSRNPLSKFEDITNSSQWGFWAMNMSISEFAENTGIQEKSCRAIGNPQFVAETPDLKFFMVPLDDYWDKELIEQAGALRIQFKSR
ncbi:tetratricopeptide repeat protein [candidate division KSB1 bacterium]|nr:tetratricopeptide repeat protein [candidate division KSB1 bacterium]